VSGCTAPPGGSRSGCRLSPFSQPTRETAMNTQKTEIAEITIQINRLKKMIETKKELIAVKQTEILELEYDILDLEEARRKARHND
jgi:hypothetical protein